MDRCGAARNFYCICYHPINPHCYLKVQLIEQVFCDTSKDREIYLWEREKFWKCQLFTNTMVWIAFLIYFVEVEKVTEKSN